VSQLTDFYQTDIMEKFLDYGIQRLVIKLCTTEGEVLPYRIELDPEGLSHNSFSVQVLRFMVLYDTSNELEPSYSIMFTGSIEKGNMLTKGLYKCALHCAGDYIKFNEKGL
jgi:hypothetical protein